MRLLGGNLGWQGEIIWVAAGRDYVRGSFILGGQGETIWDEVLEKGRVRLFTWVEVLQGAG